MLDAQSVAGAAKNSLAWQAAAWLKMGGAVPIEAAGLPAAMCRSFFAAVVHQEEGGRGPLDGLTVDGGLVVGQPRSPRYLNLNRQQLPASLMVLRGAGEASLQAQVSHAPAPITAITCSSSNHVMGSLTGPPEAAPHVGRWHWLAGTLISMYVCMCVCMCV